MCLRIGEIDVIACTDTLAWPFSHIGLVLHNDIVVNTIESGSGEHGSTQCVDV